MTLSRAAKLLERAKLAGEIAWKRYAPELRGHQHPPSTRNRERYCRCMDRCGRYQKILKELI